MTAPAPKHHARKGKKNRTILNRCWVDVATADQVAKWRKQGVSQGVLVDRLVGHGKKTDFNPTAP